MYREGSASPYIRSSAVGAVSKATTEPGGPGGEVISTPAVSSPPCARRSAISASVIARLPPTGIGQPTEWASVANINPAPAAVNDGIRESTWAATPVNKARASSPASDPHAGVPWASIRRPNRSAAGNELGTDRLSPSSNPTTAPQSSTSGPSSRRQDAPSDKSSHV